MTCVAPLLLCLLAEFPAELADTPPTGPPETESPAATWKQRAVGGAVARIHELSGPSGIHWPRGEAAAAGSDLRGGAGPDNAVIRAMFAAPEPSTRVRAVELWVTTPEPGPPDLLLAALEDPDRTVRAAAARALGRLDVATLTEQVLDALRDPLSPGAQTIHQVLPEMQDVIERPLIEVLEDDAAPSERRWAAGYALGGMGSARAAPTLARLTASPDFVLARVCAEALVKSRAPQDVGFWIGVASHPAPEVRRVALDALATLGTREAVEALHRAALGETEQELWLKEHAVRRIAELPGDTSLPILIHVLANHLPARHEAARQLARLTGLEFGENPVEWRQWYEQTGGRLPPPRPVLPETAPSPPLYEFAPWPQ